MRPLQQPTAEHLADITSGAPISDILGSGGPIEATNHEVDSKGVREVPMISVESFQCWFDLFFNNTHTGLPIILMVQELTSVQQLVLGQLPLQYSADVVWLGG